jgi:HAD superfamily hydrolase (TIGR01509 family)
MDGTLLDSERLWEAAQQQTMAYFGEEWTAADQAHSIGGPIERVVAHIASRTGGEAGHIARILVSEIEHKVATQDAHWMPGARELLAAARAQGVPTAIVSNSWRVLLDLLVQNLDVRPDVTVSSTEVDNPKPDPEPFLMACTLLGARPAATWVVEDSPTGATAGLAAGCHVLAVGPAVAEMAHPRLVTVPTLDGVRLSSLGGDGVQDA